MAFLWLLFSFLAKAIPCSETAFHNLHVAAPRLQQGVLKYYHLVWRGCLLILLEIDGGVDRAHQR
jgi:hypothetical protein